MKLTTSYLEFINELKQEVQDSRMRAHLAVNQEMIQLYWRLGKIIVCRQKRERGEPKLIETISNDLYKTFPGMKGLSSTNLKYMRQFAGNYTKKEISQQAADQIPWFHLLTIMENIKEPKIRDWYVSKTIKNCWSLADLNLQIKTNFHKRAWKSIANLKTTLPAPESDLANQLIQDTYNLQFLDIASKGIVRAHENPTLKNIRDFLLDLGTGFAFIGSQYHMMLDDESYYLDLLFFHLKLRSYVVVELRAGRYKPDYAGRMNFYLNLIDRQLSGDQDNPAIGIILCEDENGITVEYSIDGIKQPLASSKFQQPGSWAGKLKKFLPLEMEIAQNLMERHRFKA